MSLSLYPTFYLHGEDVGSVPGYARHIKYTKFIDLGQEESALNARCKKDVIYEHRRAHREGVRLEVSRDIADFAEFYNGFAESKGLPEVSAAKISEYGKHCLIMKAVAAGNALVMNCFLADPVAGRAHMMYSASQFRSLEGANARQLVGRANRFLHLEAIKYFKAEGYRCYDLGGYALGTTDAALLRINKFKDEFGGTLVQCATYVSWPLAVALRASGKNMGIQSAA